MLISYIIAPFIFAFLIGISFFVKNPIYTRRIAKSLYAIQFIFSSILFFCINPTNFAFFDISFALDKNSQILLFIINFIFFLFSIISKTFITKLHRIFYATSFLLLGLINLFLLSDNLFIISLSLFWIILINYFLFASFAKKETAKQINYQLTSDLAWFFISILLVLADFAKYFVVNEIEFAFSNFKTNLYKIDDTAIAFAFLGFLIIIAKMFNFIPFNAKKISLSNQINPFVFSLSSIAFLSLGASLFLKIYSNFDYLFYQFQDEIAFFLLINFIAFVVLSLNKKNVYKFLTSVYCAGLAFVLFSIFSFEKDCSGIFLYSIIALSLSYCLSAFVFMILVNKFDTYDIGDFKKIEDKTKLSQLFVTISLLNTASVPLLPIFGFELICFMIIFSTEYESALLNIVPYCLIFGVLILSLVSFGILYKILVEPIQKANIQVIFCNHQILVCILLVFALIILGVCPEYIFKLSNIPIDFREF